MYLGLCKCKLFAFPEKKPTFSLYVQYIYFGKGVLNG